jgi:hypothetical protein
MTSVEDGKHVRDEGLDAERHPVDATGAKPGEGPEVDRVRVGLGGDLCAGDQAELVGDGAQDPQLLVRRQNCGRAAAEEHRRDRRGGVTEHSAGEPDLSEDRLDVRRRGGATAELGGGVGVEVAVAAAGDAERDVDVEPERARRQSAQRTCGQPTVMGCGIAERKRRGHAPSVPVVLGGSAGSRCWVAVLGRIAANAASQE